MAMLYRLWVLLVLGVFTIAAFSGSVLGGGAKEKIDPSVRSSPGGYRSFHFWHSGFSGGK